MNNKEITKQAEKLQNELLKNKYNIDELIDLSILTKKDIEKILNIAKDNGFKYLITINDKTLSGWSIAENKKSKILLFSNDKSYYNYRSYFYYNENNKKYYNYFNYYYLSDINSIYRIIKNKKNLCQFYSIFKIAL